MARAFQANAFQLNAFQMGAVIGSACSVTVASPLAKFLASLGMQTSCEATMQSGPASFLSAAELGALSAGITMVASPAGMLANLALSLDSAGAFLAPHADLDGDSGLTNPASFIGAPAGFSAQCAMALNGIGVMRGAAPLWGSWHQLYLALQGLLGNNHAGFVASAEELLGGYGALAADVGDFLAAVALTISSSANMVAPAPQSLAGGEGTEPSAFAALPAAFLAQCEMVLNNQGYFQNQHGDFLASLGQALGVIGVFVAPPPLFIAGDSLASKEWLHCESNLPIAALLASRIDAATRGHSESRLCLDDVNLDSELDLTSNTVGLDSPTNIEIDLASLMLMEGGAQPEEIAVYTPIRRLMVLDSALLRDDIEVMSPISTGDAIDEESIITLPEPARADSFINPGLTMDSEVDEENTVLPAHVNVKMTAFGRMDGYGTYWQLYKDRGD